MRYQMNGGLNMETIKRFRRAGSIPQDIKNNIFGFVCSECDMAFLASTLGGEKWATDIEYLKFCPHCGSRLYISENENRTIHSENRTISSE